jgi:hypothetical protein
MRSADGRACHWPGVCPACACWPMTLTSACGNGRGSVCVTRSWPIRADRSLCSLLGPLRTRRNSGGSRVNRHAREGSGVRTSGRCARTRGPVWRSSNRYGRTRLGMSRTAWRTGSTTPARIGPSGCGAWWPDGVGRAQTWQPNGSRVAGFATWIDRCECPNDSEKTGGSEMGRAQKEKPGYACFRPQPSHRRRERQDKVNVPQGPLRASKWLGFFRFGELWGPGNMRKDFAMSWLQHWPNRVLFGRCPLEAAGPMVSGSRPRSVRRRSPS